MMIFALRLQYVKQSFTEWIFDVNSLNSNTANTNTKSILHPKVCKPEFLQLIINCKILIIFTIAKKQ